MTDGVDIGGGKPDGIVSEVGGEVTEGTVDGVCDVPMISIATSENITIARAIGKDFASLFHLLTLAFFRSTLGWLLL